ncbi:MAG TPA: 4'-phosphopantetheinyl transferase superfamily protein [Candidatus Binataceae bacterium]|nr:4'-phosphopantetheinyl transferase superfamily protein [Candidatus Binataceae bacterium]
MLAVAYRTIIRPKDGKDFAKRDRRARRKMQSVAADSLLRDLLEREAGDHAASWQLVANADCKPILVTPDGLSTIDVSMSHSGMRVAAAITDVGAIGVDLEYRTSRRSISEIAAYAFGPQEGQVVEAGGLAAFYRIWTLREALAKAIGIGFPMLADRRDYFAEAPTSGEWERVIDGRRWNFFASEIDSDYAIAVAIAPRASMPLALTIRKFN